MSSRRTFTSICLGAAALALLTSASGRAEAVSVNVTRVAELPLSGTGETLPEITANSPQSPRGGILQVGTDLWFTTYTGGDRQVGSIVSYSLVTQQFTTQHSFGLSDPDDPATTRLDGYSPWKTTLTLGDDGRIYYAATYGGGNVAANGETNGGVIGSFLPSTIKSDGVKVVWYGSTSSTVNPQNLGYTSPIYIPTSNGAYVYFNSYGGGANNWGTVQRMTLDSNGTYVDGSLLQVTQLVGPNGRQSQANMLQVGTKIYYVSASAVVNAAGNAIPTLQVIDTTKVGVPNDPAAVSQVNITNWSVGTVGSWSKPIYDAQRNAIYSLTLSAGILKFDLTTGVATPQSLLANSSDATAGSNFADPILFGNSIYYIKQSSGTGANSGGQLWRYDLDESKLYSVNLNALTLGGVSSSQSGTLSKVTENGVESLYFLTAGDANLAGSNGASLGAMFKISVTAVPEPGSFVMLVVGGLAVGTRRFRRAASRQA